MVKNYRARRGFSLTELLVVMLIIAVVIAIVLPALGGARNIAKKASSEALMRDVSIASAQFEQDQRRLPGYFGVRAVGSNSNARRGMSAMENLMLDLAGGIVPDSASNAIEVGPYGGAPVGSDPGENVYVDVDLIGVERQGSNVYFQPPEKFYEPQYTEGRRHKQVGRAGHVDEKGEPQLPDVVDAWGTPVLAWQLDTRTTGEVTDPSEFVRVDSRDPARFYWVSNQCFLTSNALGRARKNQIDVNSGKYSLIAKTVRDTQREESLAAILGNPNFPSDLDGGGDVLPTAARGKLILHGAGSDGYYLGSTDRGAKQFDKALKYGFNFFPSGEGGERYTDDEGEPTTIDIVESFDDMILSGGN